MKTSDNNSTSELSDRVQPPESVAASASPLPEPKPSAKTRGGKPSSQALGDLPPDVAPFTPIDIDALAAEVLSVLNAGESSSMKAGELIYQRLFAGNSDIFEKSRANKKYLHDLLAREELKIAKATLSRSLRAAAQRSNLPIEARDLPYSLRAELLVIKDPSKRNALALAAATERLSRSKLIPRIVEVRKSIAKPPKHVNALARLVKLSKGLRDAIGQSGVAGVELADAESREHVKVIGQNLREIDEWFKGLMAGPTTPVAPETHKATVSAELDDDETEDDEPAEEPDDEDLENHEPEDDEPNSDDAETREFVDE